MGHSHGGAQPPVPLRAQRILVAATIPFAIGTLLGLVLLWPDNAAQTSRTPDPRFAATVTRVDETPCDDSFRQGFVCSEVTARLEEGPDSGDEVTFNYSSGENAETMAEGDAIILSRPKPVESADLPPETPPPPEYYFADFARTQPLVILAVLFAAVVIAMSRIKGAAALLGLGISILVLAKFVIPAILEGSNPLAVAIVGSAAIMFLALYLSHGVNARTTAALLGTMASLAVTGVLAVTFVEMAHFTGLASEEASFLQVSAGQINLQGLLLGGIVIGALGVLDDVTVTQSSAVWELRAANPEMSRTELYRSALNVGRDHIASTVNTLVLAYAGASLPLMILLTVSPQPLATVLTTELIGAEIVRTLVGSIGLIASVPLTTALAAAVATARPERRPQRPPKRPLPRRSPEESWTPPAKEREWRE